MVTRQRAPSRVARPPRVRWQRVAARVLLYGALSSVALFTLLPFLWSLSTSLSTTGNVFEFPPRLLPRAPGFDNYQRVFTQLPLLRYALNSALLCFFGVTGTLLVSSLAAYPLARLRFPGRNVIFYAIVATLILPNEAGLIVNYITIVRLGLADSHAGVILPSLASVIGIFLLRQSYLAIPEELLDAARVDGASELRVWWQIMVPLSGPALAALGIFTFVGFWNSFIWPLIVLRTPDLYPLSVGLLYLRGLFSSSTRLIAAGTMISMIPVIVVFVAAQRYFMKGLEGAVKG